MRSFVFSADKFLELDALPEQLPSSGFLWVGCSRDEFEAQLALIQPALQRWQTGQLVDLHISGLLNAQLTSHFDYTSWYDLMVFRRLAAPVPEVTSASGAASASGMNFVQADTSPVGFAVFDRVLLTVHPSDCAVREHFALRLAALSGIHGEGRTAARLPSHPADLMLRMVNHMVDGYLDLRRLLTRHHNHLQQLLLDPRSRFNDWQLLLQARTGLHDLEDVCEDQRSAVQEWIDALDEWPDEAEADKRRERELLRVRSRDVLEHIERVLGHVRRLEQGAETVVQMHFSALSHRTNSIMRTLTVLTAIFLPLNLITGFFGMNFDSMPWVHSRTGIWLTVALMAAVALGLLWFFRRQRLLGRSAD